MNAEIKQTTFQVSVGKTGGTGDKFYHVDQEQTRTFALNKKEFQAPDYWRAIAAWYFVQDSIQLFPIFRSIDLKPQAGTNEVQLTLLANKQDGQIQITVFVLYHVI